MDVWGAEERQELDRLRRRAWGPIAAGSLTKAEYDRLTELERQAQPHTPTGPLVSDISKSETVPDWDVFEPTRTESAAPVTAPRHPPDAAVPTERESPSFAEASVVGSRWTYRFRWWVAALALVLGVVLGVGAPVLFAEVPDERLSFVETAATEDLPGRAEDYLLWGWGSLPVSDTVRVYDEFHGATVVSGTNAAGLRCIAVVVQTDFAFQGCAPHGNPLVDIPVFMYDPLPFESEFPDGSVLRFELNGDAVDVWVAEPPISDRSQLRSE